MKYMLVVLLVAASVAVHAQSKTEDDKYKINPDSIVRIPTRRAHLVEPLFILDGTPVNTERMEKLDANTLESIQVLKDSASIAPYGDKGKNGVVIMISKPNRKD